LVNWFFLPQVLRLDPQAGKHYLYCYWINPDHLIHTYGVNSSRSIRPLLKINQKVERMYAKLQDTTVVVLADHGLIDTKWVYLEDHPELMADAGP
jgi:predicted AlkP superfamily pyrophosphatase or phosphodiesterase